MFILVSCIYKKYELIIELQQQRFSENFQVSVTDVFL